MGTRVCIIAAWVGSVSCMGGTAGQSTAEQVAASVSAASSTGSSTITAAPEGTAESAQTPVAASPNTPTAVTPVTYRSATFKNGVSDQRADPGVLRTQGHYYVFATNRGDGNVPVAQSDDLVTWTASPNDALPVLPSWASVGDTWAPEVTQIDHNRFVMYFCARHTASGKQCVGTAVATTPLGPYVPTPGDPLACQVSIGGTIDPSPFLDSDGVHWVVFKNDGNCCGYPVQLWLQRLAIDGVTPVSTPTALLGVDQGWEGNLIEAPFLWLHDSTYYLFYSANNYANASYAIGYASASAIGGPYQKVAGPWIASSNTQGQVLGPGGQNVVDDDAGHAWLVYHTWSNTNYNNRVLNLAPITWTASGPTADVRFGIDETGPQIAVP